MSTLSTSRALSVAASLLALAAVAFAATGDPKIDESRMSLSLPYALTAIATSALAAGGFARYQSKREEASTRHELELDRLRAKLEALRADFEAHRRNRNPED